MAETAGIALIDKPEGVSSFAALGPLKKVAHTKRIGHTGTLDPFASGLLVVLVGHLTRIAALLSGMDKVYEAVFRFGTETDTLDPEGNVVREATVPEYDRILQTLPFFTGCLSQEPPAFSAIHVEGKRAYELARKGNPVQLAPRPVTVHKLDLIDWTPPDLRVRISCSSGTYIRSLARDIGRKAGSAASVATLRRTEVGLFSVTDAVPPADFNPATDLIGARSALQQLAEAYPQPVLLRDIDAALLADVMQGRPLSPSRFAPPLTEEGTYALFANRDELSAVVEMRENRIRYRFVVPRTA
jgi:tRNA pseudouridine55 synthase